MQAGKLRHRVTIQHRTHAQDSYGEMDITYTDGDTIWANIKPMYANELFRAQQINSKINTKIITRFRRDITTVERLKFGTRYFNVLGVIDPEEKHRELQLLCEEVRTAV